MVIYFHWDIFTEATWDNNYCLAVSLELPHSWSECILEGFHWLKECYKYHSNPRLINVKRFGS